MDQESSCSKAGRESNPPFGDATMTALQKAARGRLKMLT
jgi:hypothetical protein